MIKKLIKIIIPTSILKQYNSYRQRPIYNLYKKNGNKRVLISYITIPFRKTSHVHTNYYEAIAIAKIFDELEYIVDVMHYEEKSPNLDKYDVIFGFGDVFQVYFESGLIGKKTILYSTGMHVCHQNTSSLKRVKDVYDKRGVWLTKSARCVEKTWSHQTTLVDGIIALGNSECGNTYRDHYNGLVIEIPAPFFNVTDGEKIVSKRDSLTKNSFIWFGSSGLIHKGLDLCLEYFSTRPDLNLHVCGDLSHEIEFTNAYHKELFNTLNIHSHGFVKINSAKFNEILEQCCFIIFPSCSEGGSPSVLTAVGNGGLIPIISKETSISTGFEITIEQLNRFGIENAIKKVEALSVEEIKDLQLKNLKYVQENHNLNVYYKSLKNAIIEILNQVT